MNMATQNVRVFGGCIALVVAVLGLGIAPTANAQDVTITGTVAFTGIASTPPATIRIVEQGFSAVGVSSRIDGSFSIVIPAPLAPTAYEAQISAPCWGVQIVPFNLDPTDTDEVLGTTTLTAGSTDFATIQVVGSFTGWDIAASPFMTLLNACTWSDTVSLASGDHAFKFVTDEDFDNPPSYADFSGMKHVLPGGPFNVQLFGGFGGDIQITAPVAGDYVFTLDESLQNFSVTLIGGAPTGSVSGVITFTGLESPPFPSGLVRLVGATSTRTTQSDPTTGAYEIDIVSAGDYSLEISANCFVTETLESVTVGTAAVDLGTTNLDAGASTFGSIVFVGDFNAWNLEAPPMVQGSSCLWTVVTEIAAGTHNSKFVTDGNFDDPLDYGGNESEEVAVPGAYPVNEASGQGTAFRFTVSETATFVVTLDESTLMTTFALQTPTRATSWGLLKAGYRD